MKVAILNYPNAVMSSVIGPYDILSKTNDMLDAFGVEHGFSKFEVDIVTDENSNQSILPVIQSEVVIQCSKIYDLILIPAMDFDKVNETLENERKIINWLLWQFKEGAEIGSICLGAFLLAGTGLLDGKYATTHWMGAPVFKKMFPKVKLLDDKIITDNNRIYTCGGAYSFTSLMIYLIEKFYNHQVAILISKIFLIHIHDSQQLSFSILNLQKGHDDEAIIKAQLYIEENYNKGITIEVLSELVNMSTRTFMRRFKKATGNTAFEYIQRVRIENAKKMLEKADQGIEYTAMEVGYEDFSAFRKVFKKIAGLTPTEYKKKYGKTFLPEFVEKTKVAGDKSKI